MEELKNQQIAKNQSSKVILTNFSNMNICGVNKVFSCTENCISLQIAGSNVLIEGSSLHVDKLDVESGVVEINGNVCSIKKAKDKQKKNFIKRMFE